MLRKGSQLAQEPSVVEGEPGQAVLEEGCGGAVVTGGGGRAEFDQVRPTYLVGPDAERDDGRLGGPLRLGELRRGDPFAVAGAQEFGYLGVLVDVRQLQPRSDRPREARLGGDVLTEQVESSRGPERFHSSGAAPTRTVWPAADTVCNGVIRTASHTAASASAESPRTYMEAT